MHNSPYLINFRSSIEKDANRLVSFVGRDLMYAVQNNQLGIHIIYIGVLHLKS